MLSAPGDLDGGALAGALQRGWGIGVAAMAYRAVGWGSHHWEVAGADGTRWFVTVDELEQKRLAASESADEGFARLTASLCSAVALKDAGLDFVLAPLPLAGGRPAARLGERFAVAVYPFVRGESFSWGQWAPGQRARMAEMLAAGRTRCRWRACSRSTRRRSIERCTGTTVLSRRPARCPRGTCSPTARRIPATPC